MKANEEGCIVCGPSATMAHATISGLAIGIMVGARMKEGHRDAVEEVLCPKHHRMFREAEAFIVIAELFT